MPTLMTSVSYVQLVRLITHATSRWLCLILMNSARINKLYQFIKKKPFFCKKVHRNCSAYSDPRHALAVTSTSSSTLPGHHLITQSKCNVYLTSSQSVLWVLYNATNDFIKKKFVWYNMQNGVCFFLVQGWILFSGAYIVSPGQGIASLELALHLQVKHTLYHNPKNKYRVCNSRYIYWNYQFHPRSWKKKKVTKKH